MRDVQDPEIVVNGQGVIENPPVQYWGCYSAQRIEDFRKLDEKRTIARWKTPGGYGHRIGPILRISADKLAVADHYYRLDAALEVEGPEGEKAELTSSEVVRFLPSPGNETTLPPEVRDPTGVLPDDQAEKALRKWLRVDDWYVQTIAVIRLKESGRSLKAPELNAFFRLAALSDRNSLRLILRALDLLTAQEASAGVGKLLQVGCEWALPHAIRFNARGTQAWLADRLERAFPQRRDSYAYSSYRGYYRRRRLLDHLVALKGRKAVPLLCRLARNCPSARDYDLLLKALSNLAPDKALEAARKRSPTRAFPSFRTVPLLLRSGKKEDFLLACRHLEFCPEWEDISHYAPKHLPDNAVPVLVAKAVGGPRRVRKTAYYLLARSRATAATKACLAALGDKAVAGTIARALREEKRTDVAPEVVRMTTDRDKAGEDIHHLWPILLLDPPPEAYELVAKAYAEGKAYMWTRDFHQYLLRYPEKAASTALRWCRSESRSFRDKGISLLFDLEDSRAVPVLLDRLARRPPAPGAKNGKAGPPGDDRPRTGGLTYREINYLAAFLPPEKLPAHAERFIRYAPEGRFDLARSTTWLNADRMRTARTPLQRVKLYIGAIAEHNRRPRRGRAPTLVPSPVCVLRLRDFAPAALLPLIQSKEPEIRALGATLLGGPPGRGRVADDPVVPMLERLLADEADEVRLATFRALEARCRCSAWYCQRLLECRPGGPARAAAAAAANTVRHGAGWPRLSRNVLKLLAQGDPIGLRALDWNLPEESEIIGEALASPAMTPILARQIVEKLDQRRSDKTFSILDEALKRPLRSPIRATLIRSIAGLAADKHFRDGRVRKGVPEARQAILDALKSDNRELRRAAFAALERTSIPESIPFLVAMFDEPAYRSSSRQLALVAARQGRDRRFLAPLAKRLRSERGVRYMKTELFAYVAIAGDEALPLLRHLAATLPRPEKAIAREMYDEVMEFLTRLKDEKTLEQQADWVVSAEQSRRLEELPVTDRLRKLIAKKLLRQMADLKGEELANGAKTLCRYDLKAGMQILIRLLSEKHWYTARRAHFLLRDLLNYGFGGTGDGSEYTRRSFPQCAHHAERWWQLESGRPLEVLRDEALFP